MKSLNTYTVLILSILTFHETAALGLALLALAPGTAVGGVVTGVIATTLGSISLAVALGKLDLSGKFEEEEGGYGGRKKRDLTELHEKVIASRRNVEEFLDEVYERDHTSQCIEKMMCSIVKRTGDGAKVTDDEKDILQLVETMSSRGFTYKRMVVAEKVGYAGGDCDELFDSCPFETDAMVDFIAETARQITFEE